MHIYTIIIFLGKSIIREELFNAYEEVCNIERGIQTLKEDVRLMRLGNERCKVSYYNKDLSQVLLIFKKI